MTGFSREKQIERVVCKYAEKLGWLQFKFASPGQVGVPDRIFFRKGICILIEFKRSPKFRASKMQEYILHKLDEQGFRGYVCGSVDVGIEIFDEYQG